MRLVRTDVGLARIEDGELHLLDTEHPDVDSLLRAVPTLSAVADIPVRRRLPLTPHGPALRCPFSPRVAVWGIGLNYHAKAAATGRPVPEQPILFLKPSSALTDPDRGVRLPRLAPDHVDYEGEIAVVVGGAMRDVPPDRVWSHVAGITTANDITARDVMAASANPLLAKGFPGFGPLGPEVRALGDASDFDRLTVTTHVNGEPRQRGRADDLIFGVADLLSRISGHADLRPGDVVLTGTPPGTGQDLRTPLRPGDRITVTVGDLLPLHTEITPAAADPHP